MYNRKMAFFATYFVSWTLTCSGCTGPVLWMGFKCEGSSTRIEYVDAESIFTPGYPPKCRVVPGSLEGVCTIDVPAEDLSFAIGTGSFFRCFGDDPSQLVGSAFLPAQIGQCFFEPNVMTHLISLSLVCGDPYTPEETTIFKDFDCLEGFTLDVEGNPKCLDVADGCLLSGYKSSCPSALTERNVRQKTIPVEFVNCSPTTDAVPSAIPSSAPSGNPSSMPSSVPSDVPSSAASVDPMNDGKVEGGSTSSALDAGRVMTMFLLSLMLACLFFVFI